MNTLKNRYYALRHGESLANVAGIIASAPETGIRMFGLSGKGRDQVRKNARRVARLGFSPVIVSSDFLRTAETAGIVRSVFGVSEVRFDIRLRERFFGRWEGGTSDHYAVVWEQDIRNPKQVENGVESALAVRQRMVDLVGGLESEFCGRDLLLVSHGDPLLLLQTAFADIPAEQHRTLPGFKTAEIRPLNPGGTE